MRRYAPLILGFLLLFAGAAPADQRDDLYSAQDLERASGKYEDALGLYRRAAAGEDSGIAAEARLGAIRCLRLLGREVQAREAVADLLAGPLSAEMRAAAEEERRRLAESSDEVARLRGELDRLEADRARLRSALENEEGSREDLEKRLAEKDRKLAELTARLEDLTGGDSPEAAARREIERRQRDAREHELTSHFLGMARSLYREGRFEEALEWANRVLEIEPSNPDARELRRRLGGAPDGRDHLVREVLRVLDIERDLRLDDLRSQVDARLATGEDMLLRGRTDAAVTRFMEAIALVDSAPAFLPDLTLRRSKAAELLERARLRGGKSGVVPLSLPDDPGGEDRSARLRQLLADLASSPRSGGSRLHVHPVPAPPPGDREDPPPGSFDLAARAPPPAPLLRTLLPVLVRTPDWREADSFVRDLGDALVVYGPEKVQDEVAALLSRIAARQDPAARLTLHLLAADSVVLSRLARKAGLLFASRDDAAFAVAGGGTMAGLRKALIEGGGADAIGSLSLEAGPGVPVATRLYRSVNLLAARERPEDPDLRRVRYGVAAAFLAVPVDRGQAIAVHLAATGLQETLTLPAAGGSDLQVPSLTDAGAKLAARVPVGSSLLLTGVRNPFSPTRGRDRSVLALFVHVEGEEPVTAGANPTPVEPRSEPVDLAGLLAEPPDDPAPPFRGERFRPSGGRAGFLLYHLSEALGDALDAPGASLTMSRGAVWVRGGPELVRKVRESVEGLLETKERLVTLGVRIATLTAAEEGRLLSGLPPGGEVLEGEGVRSRLLESNRLDRSGLTYFLSGTPGRVPLPARLVARPTQLVSVSRVLRTPYLREYRSGRRGDTWPEYDSVDEGVALEVRPLLVPGERVDLTAAVRVARILEDAAEQTPERPLLAVSSARVRATLAAGQGLLLSGLPAPTPVRDRRDRLVVLLTAGEDLVK